MTNEQLYLAECVTDYLATQDWLNSFDQFTLASLRDDFVCKKSEIGAYECCVKTAHGYCCDTCLQSELHELWRVGVSTTGSCCGHGRKVGYIQVTSKDVQKMHELGYARLPDDGSSDGTETFCFKPKTYLPVFEAAGQRREDGTGMPEYIEKETAKSELCSAFAFHSYAGGMAASIIDKIPAADVRENVKAHWARKHDDVCYWSECSSCGERLPLNQWRQEWDSPVCPNCGAQMEVQDG